MKHILIIRADANAHIGTGHLMRCLALAQAWCDRSGEVVLITACQVASLIERFLKENVRVVRIPEPHPHPSDWQITSRVLSEYPGSWVVLDGYHFDSKYQYRVKEAGHRLLVIDDMGHLEHYYADILLNQNFHAEGLTYPCEPYLRLLLGTKYVLLRREFWPWRGWQRKNPEVARKVLVTLGGGDPDDQTLKVIRALRQVDVNGLETVVVVGVSNPHYETLQSAIRHLPFATRLVRDAVNMPELMTWAEVAISASGSTCWEMAFMGLPTVLLVLAQNQQGIAEGLSGTDLVLNLGWFEQVTDVHIAEAISSLLTNRTRREQMTRSGRALVDGTGSERVILALQRQTHSHRSRV